MALHTVQWGWSEPIAWYSVRGCVLDLKRMGLYHSDHAAAVLHSLSASGKVRDVGHARFENVGYLKDRMIQEQDQGWRFKDGKYVCAACFEDYAIKGFIEEHALGNLCSYCGQTADETMAAELNDVLSFIADGLRIEWMDPTSILGWESAEGGWQGTVYDTWDLFREELDEFPFQNDAVAEEVLDSFSDLEWCSRDYAYLKEGKRLLFGWDRFSELVKHVTRYMFFESEDKQSSPGEEEGVHPTRMLDAIGDVISRLELVRKVNQGTVYFRARAHDIGKEYKTVDELGPPPIQETKANRMSPQGIAMFYGSADADTAMSEVCEPGTQAVSLGYFETMCELRVVNLVDVPPVPSLFDRAKTDLRQPLSFIHNFVADLAKPIEKNSKVHPEYVPTQIATEFFRHRFTHEGERIHGILYPCSQRNGRQNIVLFCDNAYCEGSQAEMARWKEKWLRLGKAETHVLNKAEESSG